MTDTARELKGLGVGGRGGSGQVRSPFTPPCGRFKNQIAPGRSVSEREVQGVAGVIKEPADCFNFCHPSRVMQKWI